MLRLLLLLMLMMRNVLTVWCRFGRWSLVIKLSFCSDSNRAQGFKVWSRFWSWFSGKILKLKFGHYFTTDAWLWLWSLILVEILKLCFVKIFKFKFCWNADVWLIFWSWCLVEILKMFDQDLCKNLWYNLKKLLW